MVDGLHLHLHVVHAKEVLTRVLCGEVGSAVDDNVAADGDVLVKTTSSAMDWYMLPSRRKIEMVLFSGWKTFVRRGTINSLKKPFANRMRESINVNSRKWRDTSSSDAFT